jgi:prolyl-tRNA editing enzyme YbaK/EbsC (Cys-tRNA(Pro) deacylase)
MTEAVTDTSVAAQAIGISESDLVTALNNGQTMADVAKANNVDPQKVIDALVADGKQELAAAVQAGTLTQAQSDSMATNLTQRVTDQVNGTFPAHRGRPDAPPAGTQPTTTTPTS